MVYDALWARYGFSDWLGERVVVSLNDVFEVGRDRLEGIIGSFDSADRSCGVTGAFDDPEPRDS